MLWETFAPQARLKREERVAGGRLLERSPATSGASTGSLRVCAELSGTCGTTPDSGSPSPAWSCASGLLQGPIGVRDLRVLSGPLEPDERHLREVGETLGQQGQRAAWHVPNDPPRRGCHRMRGTSHRLQNSSEPVLGPLLAGANVPAFVEVRSRRLQRRSSVRLRPPLGATMTSFTGSASRRSRRTSLGRGFEPPQKHPAGLFDRSDRPPLEGRTAVVPGRHRVLG
jgi:hypothetical protein